MAVLLDQAQILRCWEPATFSNSRIPPATYSSRVAPPELTQIITAIQQTEIWRINWAATQLILDTSNDNRQREVEVIN